MFFYNKDPNFDTKLIPLHNLCCRNGIYYFRKMIKGKRYLLSLHTRDITEAYHLLFMKRYAMGSSNSDFKFFQEWLVNRENQVKTLKDLSKEEVDNEYIWKYMLGKDNQSHIGIQEVPQKVRTTKHKIMEEWTKLDTNASQPVIQTNTGRMKLMLKLLEPYDTIEDLDDNLNLIDDLKQKLTHVEQSKGKNEGQLYSPKTINDMLKLLLQVANKADENDWIRHFKNMKKKLVLKESEYNPDSKTSDRKKFSPEDLQILFNSINLMLQGNTDFLTCLEDWDSTDAEKGQNKGFYQYTSRISNYPQAYAYTCLIALFLGVRATSIATIRHKDIKYHKTTIKDPITNTTKSINIPCIHFYKDEKLVKAKDPRELVKHLKNKKNKEFNRWIPIPSLIWETLGFKNYVERHKKEFINIKDKKQYLKEWSSHNIKQTRKTQPEHYERCSGDEYFLFEEVIKTNEGYRTKYINDTINRFLILLKIKPEKDSDEMKDFHSFKTSFYSYNRFIPLDILETIAGNSVSNTAVAIENYTDRDLSTIYSFVEQITFPHIELLSMQEDVD